MSKAEYDVQKEMKGKIAHIAAITKYVLCNNFKDMDVSDIAMLYRSRWR